MVMLAPKAAAGPKIFAFGGGWQSTAALVLAARKELDVKTFVFSNVGADSEHPGTLAYLERWAKPYARAHGLQLVEVSAMRKGQPDTLYRRLTRPGSRSLPIPVRMSNGAPGTRSCTADFKIKVVGRVAQALGARPDRPAEVSIGISVDEIHRANTRRSEPHEVLRYPLLEKGIRRADCARVINEAGLPVPPKSACWFCPLRSLGSWRRLRRDEPELFERACQLEDLLSERRAALGRDPVYFSRRGMPLREAIAAADDELPLGDEGCDGGWCWT